MAAENTRREKKSSNLIDQMFLLDSNEIKMGANGNFRLKD